MMQSPARTMLDCALELASKGFRVFPLVPGKKIPRREGWVRTASSVAADVEAAWEAEASANVAIETSGMLVVDVDVKDGKGGADSWANLEMLHDIPQHPVAVTPTGGQHRFFRLPDGVHVANIVDRPSRPSPLGAGIDVRSWHGFVVGAGSIVEAGRYLWKSEPGSLDDIPLAPDWMINLCRSAAQDRPVNADIPLVELDDPAAVVRAREYLEREAEEAVQGAGGDDTTYRVACNVRDFGVSELACFELMVAYWNDRCAPPWAPDELEHKVQNAYKYAKGQAGQASPEAHFTAVPDPSPKGEGPEYAPRPRRIPLDFSPTKLPTRPWLLGTRFMRGVVTGGIGAPGVSKSTMSLLSALAIATGRGDLTGEDVHLQGRVWVHNNEDDAEEMLRRLGGLCIHHAVDPDIIRDRFLFSSGLDRRLRVAVKNKDGVHQTKAVQEIIDIIRAEDIVFMAVDPFVSTHDGTEENSNEDIERVVGLFRHIAAQTNVAIDLVHHAVKNHSGNTEARAGDMNAARGASAFIGAIRIAYTLSLMSEQSAEGQQLDYQIAARLVRLDHAKGNYSARSFEPKWFELRSVELGNGVAGPDDLLALSDTVGVPVLCDLTAMISEAQAAHAATAGDAAETAFLNGLDRLNEEGRHVSHSDRASNYAPKLIARLPEAAGLSADTLARAMERLFAGMVVEIGTVRRADGRLIRNSARHPVEGIRRVQAGAK